VERVGQLQRIVALRQPGDVVTLSVVRYGSPLQFRVRLTESPDAARPVAGRGTAAPQPVLGLELGDLTPLLARQLGYASPGGVIVAAVAPASAADRKNVLANHRILSINRQEIATVAQARALVAAARPGQILSLLLEYPDGRTYIANVRVP
jgi:serine protease Do